MSNFFNVKSVECDCGDVHDKIYELETEWVASILSRSGISKILVNKALKDPDYSAQMWRDYLFEEKKITIVKDLKTKRVDIFQISEETNKKIKIAEWTRPAIVRKKGGKSSCVLELKYWQII